MRYYVRLFVAFPCYNNDGVAELARKHLVVLQGIDEQAAIQFLEALSQRSGINLGSKGSMSFWGIVGNYTQPERFVSVLRPFWSELLHAEIEGGPLWFEHILVFFQTEEDVSLNGLEIYLDIEKKNYEEGQSEHLTLSHYGKANLQVIK